MSNSAENTLANFRIYVSIDEQDTRQALRAIDKQMGYSKCPVFISVTRNLLGCELLTRHKTSWRVAIEKVDDEVFVKLKSLASNGHGLHGQYFTAEIPKEVHQFVDGEHYPTDTVFFWLEFEPNKKTVKKTARDKEFDAIVERLDSQISTFEAKIESWREQLDADPFYAFKSADDVFSASAQREVLRFVRHYFKMIKNPSAHTIESLDERMESAMLGVGLSMSTSVMDNAATLTMAQAWQRNWGEFGDSIGRRIRRFYNKYEDSAAIEGLIDEHKPIS